MTRQFQIENKTEYSTRDLRKIMAHAVNEEMDDNLKVRIANIRFRIEYGRRWHSGYAYIGGYKAVIRLPRDPAQFNPVHFAKVVGHETAHLRGLRHRQMAPRYQWKDGLRFYEWAAPMTVAFRSPVAKPKVDLREIRYQRALANLARAKTRLKRALTIAKRWQRHVRYYERAFAVAATKSSDQRAER
jgi:hypothetical protein